MDSSTRRKILLLLYGGISIGFTYSPARQIHIAKTLAREWRHIDRTKLRHEIHALYRSKLLKTQENQDGTLTLVLSEKGKTKVLTYRFESMRIKTSEWDRKWRFIIFDIPEYKRQGRDALRIKLRELGFYELQKSVFVFPYECRDEINFLIEFFHIRPYVRYGLLTEIDNDLHLREIFHLPTK